MHLLAKNTYLYIFQSHILFSLIGTTVNICTFAFSSTILLPTSVYKPPIYIFGRIIGFFDTGNGISAIYPESGRIPEIQKKAEYH